MAFEVSQGDEHVGIHDGAADFGAFHVLAAVHGNFHFVDALQPVGNDHMAAGGERGIAVFIGGFHVVQGVFAPAHVQGVAVGQKGLSAQAFHHVGHGFGKVGPQIGQVARLAEMNFDGGEFILEIDLLHTGLAHQFFQLLLQIHARTAAHVGKIYFCFFHNPCSLSENLRLLIL